MRRGLCGSSQNLGYTCYPQSPTRRKLRTFAGLVVRGRKSIEDTFHSDLSFCHYNGSDWSVVQEDVAGNRGKEGLRVVWSLCTGFPRHPPSAL